MRKIATTLTAITVILSLLTPAMAAGIVIGGKENDNVRVEAQDAGKVEAQHIGSGRIDPRYRDRDSLKSLIPGLIGGFIIGSIVNAQKTERYYCSYHRRYHDRRDRCDRDYDWRIGRDDYLTLRVSQSDVERDLAYDQRAILSRPLKIWIEGSVRQCTMTVTSRNSHQEITTRNGQPFVRLDPADYLRGEQIRVDIEAGEGRYGRNSIQLIFTVR